MWYQDLIPWSQRNTVSNLNTRIFLLQQEGKDEQMKRWNTKHPLCQHLINLAIQMKMLSRLNTKIPLLQQEILSPIFIPIFVAARRRGCQMNRWNINLEIEPLSIIQDPPLVAARRLGDGVMLSSCFKVVSFIPSNYLARPRHPHHHYMSRLQPPGPEHRTEKIALIRLWLKF